MYDLDEDRARAFARDHGGATRPDIASVIESSDAVYVTTWTSAHEHAVTATVDAGKPVFCEKPLGTDLASAERIAARVAESGLVNQVGLVLRHSPAFRWLRHEVVAGGHGPVMSMVFRDDQYIPVQGMYASTWRSDPDRAGFPPPSAC